MGMVAELRADWEGADAAYQDALAMRWVNRHYLEAAALAGLARACYRRGQPDACAGHVRAAEEIAQRYDYNDVMASLRLLQGHLAWEPGDATAAAGRYRQALVYALRYNRYLLDEILAGRPQGTLLPPVIPFCLDRGAAGQAVLRELADWWRSAQNDLPALGAEGTARLDPGVPLLDAERDARRDEGKPGVTQRTVIEAIDAALAG
jgi:hypothetical protein